MSDDPAVPLRRALTGWVPIAVGLTVLGIGAIVGAQGGRAVAQHAPARSAVDLLQLLGSGVALLGLVLAVDLLRFRARHTSPAAGTGG